VVEAARCPTLLPVVPTKRALCRAACQPLVDQLCAAVSGREHTRCVRGIVTTCAVTDLAGCAAVGGPRGASGPAGPGGPGWADGADGTSGTDRAARGRRGDGCRGAGGTCGAPGGDGCRW